jgi:hypothetical protein
LPALRGSEVRRGGAGKAAAHAEERENPMVAVTDASAVGALRKMGNMPGDNQGDVVVTLANGTEHRVHTTGVTIFDVGAVLDLGDGRHAFIPSAGLVSVVDAPREPEPEAEVPAPAGERAAPALGAAAAPGRHRRLVPGTRAQDLHRARQALRAHPSWSDAEVAEACGIHALDIPGTVAVARRELVNAGELPPEADARAAGTSPVSS